ncbi:MAG: rhomboid family intramembrane serine protease [Erysipelotrichaceae bacterium]|nr:rhomboid family intramembrane serine protease [Erysipelotrichaceae bacterium]
MIYILILINAAVFFLMFNGKLRLKDLGQSYQTVFRDKQYYRIITSAFTHKSLTHIFFNMFALYNVGQWVQAVYGTVGFAVIYFVSIILGQTLSLYIRHDNGEDGVLSVGASGGICGLIGAYLVAIIFIFGIQNTIMNFAVTVAYIVIMSIIPGVDGTSHICCFAFGLIIAYLLMII